MGTGEARENRGREAASQLGKIPTPAGSRGWASATAVPTPGTPRGRGEPCQGCRYSGIPEFPRAGICAGQQGWQPGLLAEGNSAARGKTELLKGIKKERKLGKKGNKKKKKQL